MYTRTTNNLICALLQDEFYCFLGIPNKPDGIPVRAPNSNLCQGMNVSYSCSGLIGAPPGYFRWTKLSSEFKTIYNATFISDIPGECNINRTSTLAIEVHKEDNNATFRCEVIHELATSEMYQETLPGMFVYGNASLYVISDVEIENSGSYICVVETIVNRTEEKYNQTVTIDIRMDHSKEISVDKTFAESTAGQIIFSEIAGIVTITVVFTVGVLIASVVPFKTIKKARHLQTLKTDDEKKWDISIDCSYVTFTLPETQGDFGIFGGVTQKGQSPTHPDQSVAKPSRGISISMQRVRMTKRISLPVGSGICYSCIRKYPVSQDSKQALKTDIGRSGQGKFNDSSEVLFTTETGISNAEESDNLDFTKSKAITVELQQHGSPVLGSTGVELSCIVKAEDDEIINSVEFSSGSDYKTVIKFDIKDNMAGIVNPDGIYLEGRVTLKNLLSSENRTVVEYNLITCEDNTAYRCAVELEGFRNERSNTLSIEVKGTPNKPDTIPKRTPDGDICQGININFTCSGNIGKPPGYLRWTKVSNGSTTIYNGTDDTDMKIPGTCVVNRTSILSIDVQKEDNNAIFRCEVKHELATPEMYQETIPEIFVYDHPYEFTVITKEPDRDYHDTTTPFIELTCFAQGCSLSNYTWYKDTDLNTTIGNDSLYRISNVSIQNSGNYICIVETIINGTDEKYNQTVTIDIRNPEQPEQLPIEGVGFADTAAGLATIAVVSVVGAVLTSIFLFKIIQKVKHLRMLKKIGVKDVKIVNNAEPDNEATQGIDDGGFVSEVSQQWKNNAPIQSTM
ncbi:Hypothetical predicted protein [Mytilus galloprovincialis]|uniref:Ig-like domain-containing protein n=1 Tax=Mytilus galloprovincialis TaxID=29158 RepID=A0A8B6CEH5_MYTGA|nr:Hypothetical predicted protein [Mytilus galloprovincialis]